MFVSRLLDFQKTRYARFMNHRVPSNCRYQPTEYEHAANCATHAFWILPSILGSSILYILSDDQWETISAWIYGFGLSSLFIVSTIFHTISWKKRHLRTVEHCLHMFDRMVIYFFIAASYAPWLNLRELGPWASHMRWIIWIMASVGTVYVFFFHERYKLVELVCYVIMGFFPALVILSMSSQAKEPFLCSASSFLETRRKSLQALCRDVADTQAGQYTTCGKVLSEEGYEWKAKRPVRRMASCA
ncbi:monocyte to macrophage differentiation factor 2 isoform X2 [Pogoniulus pusillus]|uniref:monocyte to macrophage differentiation factor 2 isoform X2 n=1 Tax=Pogoniulus pusillus TaxID=488313 RepID=UPI0030B93EE3